MLIDLECLVEHFTRAYEEHKDAPGDALAGEWHFSAQIKLAKDKAEQYYASLDDSTAYIAAIILHPGFNVQFLEAQWSSKKAWVTTARKQVKSAWTSSYKQQPVSEAISPQKNRASGGEYNVIQAYREAGIAKARDRVQRMVVVDEFDRYCAQDRVDTDCPLEWWRTTGARQYSTLAQMAIDILSIPAMSDEPERVFSRLGLMITDRRNRLEQSTIQATTCLHSWDKAGVINMRNKPPECT